MIVSRQRIAPLVFGALLLQLVLSLPTYTGLVLCVGSNGHVAVERGGCAEESAAAATRCNELGEPTPCSDTPLSARELVSTTRSRADEPAGAAVLPAFPSVASTFLSAPRSVSGAVFADPSRVHRRSILRL